MYNLRAALKKAGIDNRRFEQGEIYLVGDEEVKIPDDKITNRTFHNTRPVVIVYNHPTNWDPLYPIIVAAPLSHEITRKRETDLEVFASEDGVECDCLLRLGLIQPFLKCDLHGPKGKLSERRIEQMLALLLHLLGVDMDDADTAVI
ncbi:type II toxin-antitoxin system PemK/MazF family toxin [Desulfofundulus salinus]|uniref:Type II toxin-antitoxin system PemK/MazF family toxin n=1 Tax=Desulfofundulus salinus TaxID=2419843 RepID=A0A494WSH1_9FIRM|nr:type II toxin-antitoxin system PemK/MazF family toxin [Desulfofundulus salinum]RKO65683.1 hypothetical protein D7024_01005 [Desulfofundulus salinum]